MGLALKNRPGDGGTRRRAGIGPLRQANLRFGLRPVWLRTRVRPHGRSAGPQHSHLPCKAYTAARMGVDTSAFAARLRRDDVPASSFCDDKLTDLPGGSVVKDGDRLIGAVGISGACTGGGPDDLGNAGSYGPLTGSRRQIRPNTPTRNPTT